MGWKTGWATGGGGLGSLASFTLGFHGRTSLKGCWPYMGQPEAGNPSHTIHPMEQGYEWVLDKGGDGGREEGY